MLTGLFDHLDERCARLGGGGDFSGEVDAGPFHAFGCFESEVEAEAIDRGHGGLGCFELGVGSGEEDHGVNVVGVHVREDLGSGGAEGSGADCA